LEARKSTESCRKAIDINSILKDWVIPAAQSTAVAVLVVGIVVYAFMLFGVWLDWYQFLRPFKSQVEANPGYLIGLPVSAVAAFGIVSVLEIGSGKLEFKAFGLDFTGPAGPATLWLVCYLALVGSIGMVGPKASNSDDKGGGTTVPANADRTKAEGR
jgi:hypothetical protein